VKIESIHLSACLFTRSEFISAIQGLF